MGRIKQADKEKIINAYENGLSMAKIGKLFQTAPASVMRLLDSYGIEKRTKGGIYKLNDQEIIAQYLSGTSTTKIAEELGVTPHTVIKVLADNGVMRTNNYHNVNLVENYWEAIDTYDKAYFLGFLITDGNVIGNSVKLQLSRKDRQILEVFSQKTKNENKIYDDRRNFSAFAVKRKKWVKDLAQYGVIPNKTSTVFLPHLSNDLMSHLVRGLIDGDGWINTNGRCIGFCGNQRLVTELRNFLVQELDVFPVKIRQTKIHLWSITWASKKDIQKIGEYIYRDKGDCFLERKYNNFWRAYQANTEVSSEIAQGSETP